MNIATFSNYYPFDIDVLTCEGIGSLLTMNRKRCTVRLNVLTVEQQGRLRNREGTDSDLNQSFQYDRILPVLYHPTMLFEPIGVPKIVSDFLSEHFGYEIDGFAKHVPAEIIGEYVFGAGAFKVNKEKGIVSDLSENYFIRFFFEKKSGLQYRIQYNLTKYDAPENILSIIRAFEIVDPTTPSYINKRDLFEWRNQKIILTEDSVDFVNEEIPQKYHSRINSVMFFENYYIQKYGKPTIHPLDFWGFPTVRVMFFESASNLPFNPSMISPLIPQKA